MNETIKVTWTTTIEEQYTAEIPVTEYNAMIDSGLYVDELAEWEDDGPSEVAVTDREINF